MSFTSPAAELNRKDTVFRAIVDDAARLLGGVGIYGVLAQSVAARTQQLGVQIALPSTAVLACAIPAARAARIDPLETLPLRVTPVRHPLC